MFKKKPGLYNKPGYILIFSFYQNFIKYPVGVCHTSNIVDRYAGREMWDTRFIWMFVYIRNQR